jgi:hypothetical protein
MQKNRPKTPFLQKNAKKSPLTLDKPKKTFYICNPYQKIKLPLSFGLALKKQ